jgi:hypothetical protein
MSGRLFHAKMRGLGALGALGDNYNATDASQCSSDEMFITDVGCVTRGHPASTDSGPSLQQYLTPGTGTQTGVAGSPGGSNWLTSLIGGAAQVGAAAVTGQNPFAPKPTSAPGGFFSGATPWLIGGGLLAVLLLTRRRSAQ